MKESPPGLQLNVGTAHPIMATANDSFKWLVVQCLGFSVGGDPEVTWCGANAASQSVNFPDLFFLFVEHGTWKMVEHCPEKWVDMRLASVVL